MCLMNSMSPEIPKMINDLLITINEWMTAGTGIAALGCFLWGMVSVILSPCHMASIPLMIGYVAGQEKGVHTKSAAFYAVAFTFGLFITIALVGIICSMLGRMLGDVGPWWTILLGALLIWVALDMVGVKVCSFSGGLMAKIQVRGMGGAFLLGLAYGVLSGSCTFGFIAPSLPLSRFRRKSPPVSCLLFFSALATVSPLPLPVPAWRWFAGFWKAAGSSRVGFCFGVWPVWPLPFWEGILLFNRLSDLYEKGQQHA